MIYLVELVDDNGHDIYFIGTNYNQAEASFIKVTEHLNLKQQNHEMLIGPIPPTGMPKVIERFFPYTNDDVNISFLAKSSDLIGRKDLYLKQFQDNWEEPLN